MLRWLLFSLTVCASAAVAEENWSAPELVPDNPILKLITGKTDEGQIMVLGPDGTSGKYHPGTQDFWTGIIEEDADDLIGYAGLTDGVGMAFYPQFTVWFPMKEGFEEFRAGTRPEQSELWNAPDRRIWVVNTRDVMKPKEGLNIAMTLLVFKLDYESGEQPGICHARQVVTVLYTGEADEDGLAKCLAGHF